MQPKAHLVCQGPLHIGCVTWARVESRQDLAGKGSELIKKPICDAV